MPTVPDIHRRGTRAAQATIASPPLTVGTLYFVTDEGVTERWAGSAWESYSPAAGALPAHHLTHENGGADEVSVDGLSGWLADGQTPLPHHLTHENGGTDEVSVAGLSGLLADAQTPLAHHATHETGGSDAITALDAAVLTSGTLAPARLPAGTGDVVGPAAATLNALAIFANTTGKLLKDGMGAVVGTINALVASAYVAVGVNPAQSGAIRLASGGYLQARNASNSGDILAFGTDGANNMGIAQTSAVAVYIGVGDNPITLRGPVYTTGVLTVQGAAVQVGVNPAQAGAVRLANAQAITARNAANTADLHVLGTNAADQVSIGNAGSTTFVPGYTNIQNSLAVDQHAFIGGVITAGQYAAIGVNPAQSGAVRLANNQSISARNAANTADINMVRVTAGNLLELMAPVTLTERAAPAAPAADAANLWLQDNGSGKSQLMIQFATGAAMAIATQA